eukprot:TRINITY_DN11081_c0_g1_i1.p1 TRINITY_DN11081_c0_g1~~TRINITY_DN11081_c0_g1_i1.p1  ORF type:complete len:326 (+),score=53.40 TRINITY_DN11081_c0_g1_i1:538-1515(+)
MRISLLALAAATSLMPVCGANDGNSNTYAVIVSSSKFWYNYRHTANALGVYHAVKRFGIPDERIILMLADNHACNPRNPYAPHIYHRPNLKTNLFDTTVQVDYRDSDVTADNFMRLLSGRLPKYTPPSRKLNTSPNSKLLIYVTGHGGVDFFKFQDKEIISGAELGNVFTQMYSGRRYKDVLFFFDTCHAESMLRHIRVPNVISVASSNINQDSYGTRPSTAIGAALSDEFSGHLCDVFEGMTRNSSSSVHDTIEKIRRRPMRSEIRVLSTHHLAPSQIPIMSFVSGDEDTSKHQSQASVHASEAHQRQRLAPLYGQLLSVDLTG